MNPEDPAPGASPGPNGPAGVERPRPVCSNCRSPLSADDAGEFCPVCLLRSALDEAAAAGEERETELSEFLREGHFEHFELLTREDGTPLELGRGAMGISS